MAASPRADAGGPARAVTVQPEALTLSSPGFILLPTTHLEVVVSCGHWVLDQDIQEG